MALNARFVKDYATNLPPRLEKLPVAASQAIEAGDVLDWSSGQLAIAGDGTGEVVAVAAEDSASQTAGTLIEVKIVTRTQVWEMIASADASAIVRDGTATYDLTAAQLVNVADTTGGSLQVVDIDADDNTLVQVQFASTYFAG